jgi:hypothetical protein
MEQLLFSASADATIAVWRLLGGGDREGGAGMRADKEEEREEELTHLDDYIFPTPTSGQL